MTMAWELIEKELKRRGLDATQVMEVHDEATWECDESIAEEVADLMEKQLTSAGEKLGISIKITGKASIGDNWLEIH